MNYTFCSSWSEDDFEDMTDDAIIEDIEELHHDLFVEQEDHSFKMDILDGMYQAMDRRGVAVKINQNDCAIFDEDGELVLDCRAIDNKPMVSIGSMVGGI